MTEEQIRATLKRIVKSHGTYQKAAKALGVSFGYLGDVISGRRAPTGQLLIALKLERKTIYTRLKSANSR